MDAVALQRILSAGQNVALPASRVSCSDTDRPPVPVCQVRCVLLSTTPRGLPPMRLAAVHSALRGIAGSAAKKLPPVTRTGVHTDNPLRCTAVEHAVKLIVEGQVASMATSCDKRIATTH